jgi:hypothetical protein
MKMKLTIDEKALLQAVDSDLHFEEIPPLASNNEALAYRANYSGEELSDLQATADSILKKFNTDSLVGAINIAKMTGLI